MAPQSFSGQPSPPRDSSVSGVQASALPLDALYYKTETAVQAFIHNLAKYSPLLMWQ